MADKEPSKVTISELADVANISRKTFYLHYSTVSEVLENIETDILGKIDALCLKHDFWKNNFQPYLFFLSLNQLYEEDSDFYGSMVKTKAYKFMEEKLKMKLKSLIIESAISRGYKDMNKLQYAAEFNSSGIIAIYLQWVETGQMISLNELALMADEFIR